MIFLAKSPSHLVSSVEKECHHEIGDSDSIRQQVYFWLDKNPLLTPKPLCKLLKISYKYHGRYVANLRTQWKYHLKNERGSKCSSVRRVFFGCVLPVDVNVGLLPKPLVLPWKPTRAKNRFRVFVNGLGRVQWFETGTVIMYVRKPASLGRAKQLFCDGFTKTNLITDIRVLEEVFETLRIRGGKADYLTEQRLPYLVIKDFKDTNGLTIVLGDRSHPNAVHVLFEYQEQVAKVDQLLTKLLEGTSPSNGGVPEDVLRRNPVGVS